MDSEGGALDAISPTPAAGSPGSSLRWGVALSGLLHQKL